MTALAYPTKAQIRRAVEAAEAAGLVVAGVRVEPGGAIIVLAPLAPIVVQTMSPSDSEPNDFD